MWCDGKLDSSSPRLLASAWVDGTKCFRELSLGDPIRFTAQVTEIVAGIEATLEAAKVGTVKREAVGAVWGNVRKPVPERRSAGVVGDEWISELCWGLGRGSRQNRRGALRERQRAAGTNALPHLRDRTEVTRRLARRCSGSPTDSFNGYRVPSGGYGAGRFRPGRCCRWRLNVDPSYAVRDAITVSDGSISSTPRGEIERAGAKGDCEALWAELGGARTTDDRTWQHFGPVPRRIAQCRSTRASRRPGALFHESNH